MVHKGMMAFFQPFPGFACVPRVGVYIVWGCGVVIGWCVWRVHLRVSVCVGGKLVDKVVGLGFQGHVAGPVGIVVCYREYLGGLLRVGGFDYCRNRRGVSVCMLPHGWM